MTIAIVVLAMTITAALVMAVSLRGKIARPSRRVAIVAVIAAVAGVWLVVRMSREIAIARETKAWPTVSGLVISSRVTGDRAIRPLIVYQYSFDGVLRTDSSSLGIPSFGNRRVRTNESETIVSEYRTGDSVTVYVDPHNAAHSTLYAREDWSTYVRLMLGSLFVGLGVLLGALTLWPRK